MAWPVELDIMETLIEGCDEPVAFVAVTYRARASVDEAGAIESARRFVLHHCKQDQLRVYSTVEGERVDVDLRQLRTMLDEPWVWDVHSERARGLMLEATAEAERLWWHADDRDWCQPERWP